MKQLNDELRTTMAATAANLTWLDKVHGIGHKIERPNGAIGYYTGENGFILERGIVPNAFIETIGAHEFAASDTNGTAAYFYLASRASLANTGNDTVLATYPMGCALIGPAEHIEAQAHALAFLLCQARAEGVSIEYSRNMAEEEATKRTGRKSRSTAIGLVTISFSWASHIGRDCVAIANC